MDAPCWITKLVSGSIHNVIVDYSIWTDVGRVKDHVDFITFKLCRLETGVAPIIKSGESGLGTLAEVRYNGHVKLFVPAILSISCIMDMTMYPFDIQRCNLKFGELNNLIAWV